VILSFESETQQVYTVVSQRSSIETVTRPAYHMQI